MKTKMLKFLTFLLIAVFSTSASAAIVMSIGDVNVPLNATSASVDVIITGIGDTSATDVNSAGGKLILDTGLTFTGGSFAAPASSWGTQLFLTTGPVAPTFSGVGSNPGDVPFTVDALPYATLTFDIAASESAILNNVLSIGFDTTSFLTDIGNSAGDSYTGVTFDGGSVTVVPIPSTLLLLGAGLVGLVGMRRRVKS